MKTRHYHLLGRVESWKSWGVWKSREPESGIVTRIGTPNRKRQRQRIDQEHQGHHLL